MKTIYTCNDKQSGDIKVFLISAVNLYGFLVECPGKMTKFFLNPDEWILSDRFEFLPIGLFDEIHRAMCKAFGDS
jgi:hypothetical protein